MKFNAFVDSLSIKSGLIATVAILALGGCIGTSYPYMRTETAQRIAAPAWMIKRDITAEPFILRVYERIHDRGGVAHLYIGGEGIDTMRDPTPKNPVALHLASKDKADNVIYIARPCQYTSMASPGEVCDSKYWKESQFSETVLSAYQKALDEIAARYDIRGFDLIGYSGGGTIATLLAARRDDVVSLRTIAGILDHTTYTKGTAKAPLSDSLNPVTQAEALTKVPQYHFVGAQDTDVPPAVLHSYLQSLPPGKCVQTMFVQEATHDAGWVDKWPELLDLPVTCYAPAETTHTEIVQTSETKQAYENMNGEDLDVEDLGNFVPPVEIEEEVIMPPTIPQDLPPTLRESPAKP